MEREGLTGACVTSDMLKRRLVYDAMDDPTAVCAMLGLVGDSDEGIPYEQAASEARLTAVQPLSSLLSEMTSWLAEVATRVQIGDNPDGEEIADNMYQMFFNVIRCSVFSSLSVLIDLGLMHPSYEEVA